jgi:His/Glu/Gln/Arg/opine family amino acid ABC transporter permease subunit
LNYDWDFSKLSLYAPAYWSGIVTTLSLTIMIIVMGTILGVLLGLLMREQIVRLALYPLIDVIRALPPLVFILFMYYLLSDQVVGTTVPEYWVCVIALSLNLAAFTSDLVRSASENVAPDAVDAAYTLGMSPRQVTRYIVLPYVMREIIPGMTALYVGMLKNSSLASVISVHEVVYTTQTIIARTARSLEAWIVVGLIYMTLVIPATYGVRQLEQWAERGRTAARKR